MGQRAGAGRPYAPSRSYLQALEGYQRADLGRLHGADPFGGPGLGFTPEQMAARMGGDVDQAGSEYASNLSDIQRQAALRGPAASVSGAFYRNRQRAAGDLLARSAEARRRNIIADAFQRRQDLYSRLGITGGNWLPGTGLYNAVEAAKGRRRAAPYELGSSLLAAYGMSRGGRAGAGAAGTGLSWDQIANYPAPSGTSYV